MNHAIAFRYGRFVPNNNIHSIRLRRRKRDALMSLLRQQASDQARSVTEQVLKLAEATIQQ